jgi:hypothetical protein
MSLMNPTCNTEKMNAERIFARIFVGLGGLFWVLMFFGSQTSARYSNLVYKEGDLANGIESALIPLVIVVIVFVLGLFYEKLAAVVLLAGAVAVVVYGFIAGWDGFVLWMTVSAIIVAPMVIAAVLYLLAARTQDVCIAEEKSALPT